MRARAIPEWARAMSPTEYDALMSDTVKVELYDIVYELGRQHQRESDAALCESEYPLYGGVTAPCFDSPSECAEAIRNNTGDQKCQNPK